MRHHRRANEGREGGGEKERGAVRQREGCSKATRVGGKRQEAREHLVTRGEDHMSADSQRAGVELVSYHRVKQGTQLGREGGK